MTIESTNWTPDAFRHRFVVANGVRLHVAEAGNTGPLVLLLHGFPECWASWIPVMGRLVDAGFRVAAPDMRGYGTSEKPRGVGAYRWDALTGDIHGLVDALGERQVHLVGHDWGAIVAWMTVMDDASRYSHLTICNVPHPAHFTRMALDPAQLRRSWYIAWFQLPRVPERTLQRDDHALLRRVLKADRIPGTLDPALLELQIEAATQPGALTAMLNYYRAMVRQGPRAVTRRLRRITVPTIVCWGQRDRALGVDYAAPPTAWVPDCEVRRFPDASHWVQVDRPDAVARAIRDLHERDRVGARERQATDP